MDNAHLTLLISFLFVLRPSSSSSTRCNPNDKKALLKIKKSLNNPYLLASWNPTADCCDWYCLQCDLNTNRVTKLTIFAGQLSGHIPAAVGDLPYLEYLMFHKLSNLSGEIPPEIVKLKNLKSLRLSWTNLSGPVPQFLSQLQNLVFLDLAFNNFSGSIPASLSNLPNLTALHLDRNLLTGSIPESFGKFPGTVPDLYLSHNRLTGEIPKSLGNLDFSVIDFSRNELSGDASMLFSAKKTTQRIDISRNLFEFDFSAVRFPSTLNALDVNHNKIRGNIPSEITALEDLQGLNVSYNRMCGEIPIGGEMSRFDYSSFFHNRCLCGPPLGSCKLVNGSNGS